MKGKLRWGAIVMVLALAVVPLSCTSTEEGSTPGPPGSGYIGPGNYSVDGELCIIPANWTTLDIWPTLINWSTLVPSTKFDWSTLNVTLENSSWLQPLDVYLKRGEEADIPILLHFDSHNPEVTQVPVIINPVNGSYSWKVYYGILDDEGNEIGEGFISSAQVLSYNVTGTVVIKSGETLPLTMIVRLPENLPKRISKTSFDVPVIGIYCPPEVQNLDGMNWVRVEVHIVD